LNKFFLTFSFSIISLLSGAQTFSDFSKEEVYSDLSFLYNQLKHIHPNADGLNAAAINEITSQLNSEYYSENDAFFIFNGVLKNLNDGHSNVNFSSHRTREILEYADFFPFQLAFFDSTAVITSSVGVEPSDFKRREIFKINNVPIKRILNQLEVVAMVDGEYNESVKEWLAEDFWFYFTLYNGFRSSYSITYLEQGREFHEIAKAVSRKDILQSSILDQFKAQPIHLDYLAEQPVLTISNFDQKNPLWWKKELRRIFRQLERNSQQNLILDLRNNGGGKENLQNILLSYFGISPEDKYQSEALRVVNFNELQGVKNKAKERFKSKGLEHVTFKKERRSRFAFKRTRVKHKPEKKRFNGQLYVLLDGTTFSCGSDAAAILKEHYENTTLIGTESRGSGKVNYAGYFLHVVLPNTKFEIRVPRVKYVLNNDQFSEECGVIPDVTVEMKKDDIQSNVDTQLSYIINYLNTAKSSVFKK